ncbi:transcription antiterminator [Sporosarcina sp. Marseille-Q4063]|uniref:BglG family transcription antiterminator n=1 Tax=Sporosarcina sp. Marseille-Q4063 TaxID=2810514 RepID=UPI001BAF8AC3|nr:BglG family transcription antiterminator [Sporosarcina sp. Marseille-Q4063]QUW21670.1 transcription antiterminator [Sporosarcina sp. Marseille-Q4063]
MNVRQLDLINILLTSKERYLLVDDLAQELNCSEKTIRNDLKYAADLFKKHSTIQLNRKPGFGVFLLGKEEDRRRLLMLLSRNREKPTDERIFDMTYELLTAVNPLTLQHFSDQHFTNRTSIQKDLEVIAEWLRPFEITLELKQNIGVFLKAEETKRRSAIAHLVSTHTHKQQSIIHLFPEHEVHFVTSIIKKQGFAFTDETLDRLVIHIIIMIKRIKQRSPILIPEQDSKITEQVEYDQALQLVKEIEPFFALRIPESEVTYLAWHLISGKKLTIGKTNNPFLERLVTELIAEMTRLTKIDFDTDNTLFQGLSIHLQPVLNRLSYQLPIKNPLLTEIKNKYPYMFSMVILALKKSDELFQVILLEDEVAYIVLHFQASVERQKQVTLQKKRAIIVCHLGIGMSHLLRSKIERQLPDLKIIQCISKADLHNYLADDLDLIISTVELPDMPIQHIVISPLFDLADQECLLAFINSDGAAGDNQNDYATLLHFIDKNSIFLHLDVEHRFEVVEMLATSLYKQGFVQKEFIHTAVLRERTSATSIGSSIAIPHGNPTGILRSGIAVAILKQPIEWGSEKVSLVFLLAVVDEDSQVTKRLFNELSFLSEQDALIKELTQQNNTSAFLKCLTQ